MTVRKPTSYFMGSVLIWHIYQPWSLDLTSLMLRLQCFFSLPVIDSLGFFVIN